MKIKRVPVCILSIGLCISSFLLIGCSNSDISEGLLFEKIEDKKEYCVFDLGETKGENIVIPAEYNGLPVTAIADGAFQGENTIVTVHIPETVTEIGKRAFYDCRNLEEVFLPSSLKIISNELFVNCHKLDDITIPDSVVTISNGAFKGCGLNQATIPDSVQVIGVEAFKGCVNLESVTIGKGVENIQPYAFADCFNLVSATFREPENWSLTGVIFKEGALQSPQSAAELLTEEMYTSRIWTKISEK